MKIVLSGGGTLGSVAPLLAVAEAFKKKYPETEFIWVGTKEGPEKDLLGKYDFSFFALQTAKWRRYFSFLNFTDFFNLTAAFLKSFLFLWQEKPDLMISAGGFISVPLHWAGAVLGIPAWIHQQDLRPGLANKLMSPFAKKITVALEKSVLFFPKKKTEWIGNSVRELKVVSKTEARKRLELPKDGKVIFAFGGGTGSESLNRIILESLPSWPRDWHIIHLLGKERPARLAEGAAKVFPNYHVYRFFTDEIIDAYSAADIVIARAGFSTITELAFLSKPAILIPMVGTHQEDNVKFFAQNKAAAFLGEDTGNGLRLAMMVKYLMEFPEECEAMGERLHKILPIAKEEKMIKIIEDLTKRV
ncbi:MAG: UDP-N-acetylglucosamine--N-acetylmuramyl-(pentapeptide) pyrophosphoryl-undecaprenol N-acetylglucosamine transferase [Patescibacteria group bacterium]